MSVDNQEKPKKPQPTLVWGSASKVCPTCGGSFPGDLAECPHDGTPLAQGPLPEEPGAAQGQPPGPGAGAPADLAPPPGGTWAATAILPAQGAGPRMGIPQAVPPSPPPPDEASEEDPMVGQLLRGKWRVLKRLGAGSFGTVYKVRDEKGGWIEALKILGVDRLTGMDAENARLRFLREAQIMKDLGKESPHIVGFSTYEEDLEAGLIYFLMEFVAGKSLADLVRDEGPFPLERVLRLAIQVCEALIVAHEGPEQVVHRDLKLENLMLTKDRAGAEVVKVLDFGIAKIAEREADSRLTSVGTSLGTPGYAAPEQLRAGEVDGRTDLFAFGVILYSLLTGRDPWLGLPAGVATDQIYELMVASDRGDVKPIAESGVEVSPAMENVVMRLLRRDPGQRFQSARELREALERIAAGAGEVDAGSLRVLTDPPGVEVEVRSGRQVVAKGLSPRVANGIAAGTYRICVVDPRYEATETTVTLAPGALDDVTVVARLRDKGAGAAVRRHPAALAAAGIGVLLLAGVGLIQPWGRTVDLADLQARTAEGTVTRVYLFGDGIGGSLSVLGFLPAPFRTPVPEEALPEALQGLRSAGAEVNTWGRVSGLLDEAVRAQKDLRYFGFDGADVRSFAERILALEPESPEAASLLRKVAERMAWDAEAALQGGEVGEAGGLLEECLALVPDYPRCVALRSGG